ncbi:hypothetical protein EB796_019866 [Bugula neritina]|uniref:Uncharacterized protein n=1 Tax=Bugula neritina TaxID=10212 RepID=A0A7J7J721_BUGNE|nr:hypothetical protein EB796_019866 [Bugula neritina]
MEYTSKSSTVHQKQEVTTSTEYTKSTNIADGSIQDTLTIYVNTSQVDKSMTEESYMHYNTADSLPLTTPHVSDKSLTYGPLINFDDMLPDNMLPEIETGSFVTIESTEPDYMSDSVDYLHYSFNSLASVPEEFLSSDERLSLINHSLIANKSSLMSDDSFSGGSLSCREESNSISDLDSLVGATSSADVSNVLANQEITSVSSEDDSQSMTATDETVMTPLIDDVPKSTRKDNSRNSLTNQMAFSRLRLVEINFDKLNRLCSPELLPKEISLTLHSTASSVASSVPSPSSSVTDNLYSSSELGGDDSLGSIQYTPVFPKHVNKLNGSKTEQFSKNVSSGGRKNSNPANKFTREESIIDLEIKLQQEREKDLHIQRELARSSLSSPPASNKQGTTTTPAYAPIVVNGTHHNVQNGSSSNLKDVSLHKSAPEEEKTPDTTDGALAVKEFIMSANSHRVHCTYRIKIPYIILSN